MRCKSEMKDAGFVDECIEVDAVSELVPSHKSFANVHGSTISNSITCSVWIALPAVMQSVHGRKINTGRF